MKSLEPLTPKLWKVWSRWHQNCGKLGAIDAKIVTFLTRNFKFFQILQILMVTMRDKIYIFEISRTCTTTYQKFFRHDRVPLRMWGICIRICISTSFMPCLHQWICYMHQQIHQGFIGYALQSFLCPVVINKFIHCLINCIGKAHILFMYLVVNININWYIEYNKSKA